MEKPARKDFKNVRCTHAWPQLTSDPVQGLSLLPLVSGWPRVPHRGRDAGQQQQGEEQEVVTHADCCDVLHQCLHGTQITSVSHPHQAHHTTASPAQGPYPNCAVTCDRCKCNVINFPDIHPYATETVQCYLATIVCLLLVL